MSTSSKTSLPNQHVADEVKVIKVLELGSIGCTAGNFGNKTSGSRGLSPLLHIVSSFYKTYNRSFQQL